MEDTEVNAVYREGVKIPMKTIIVLFFAVLMAGCVALTSTTYEVPQSGGDSGAGAGSSGDSGSGNGEGK